MEVAVLNVSGQEVGRIELPAAVFGATVSRGLMHQALVRQMANGRRGTHKAKGRSEINRTTAKMYRQKGTGRARHGSRRAPIFVGGGVAHGPQPRSYTQKMPRKMRQAALRSALSAKAKSGDIVVLDELTLARPRTRDVAAVLETLVPGSSALILMPGRDRAVELSARNLPHVHTLSTGYLNIRDLLGYDKLVLLLAALPGLESHLGAGEVTVALSHEEMEEE